MGPTETAAAATVAVAVGTFWFWMLFVAVNVIILTAIEYEKGGLATATFLATLVGLQVLCGVPILSYLWEHPLSILLAAGGFAAVGSLWAIGKWWFYVTRQKDRYNDARETFLKNRGVKDDLMTEELKAEWTEYLKDDSYGRADARGFDMDDIPPKPKNHKGDITMWIAYWPWSMTWTLLNDPIKRIGKWVYRKISGILESISLKVFAGTENDLLTSEQVQLRKAAKSKQDQDERVAAERGGRAYR